MRVPTLVRCPAIIKAGAEVDEMTANIDAALTIMEARGLKTPTHMDGESFPPLAEARRIPWRKDFLYVYYWEKNCPRTPTTFAIRNERYQYITYYGLWDAGEFYDLKLDPDESRNLIDDLQYQKQTRQMENQLYAKMTEPGGMEIPLNQPVGEFNKIRLHNRGGEQASDFQPPMVVDKPVNTNTN